MVGRGDVEEFVDCGCGDEEEFRDRGGRGRGLSDIECCGNPCGGDVGRAGVGIFEEFGECVDVGVDPFFALDVRAAPAAAAGTAPEAEAVVELRCGEIAIGTEVGRGIFARVGLGNWEMQLCLRTRVRIETRSIWVGRRREGRG